MKNICFLAALTLGCVACSSESKQVETAQAPADVKNSAVSQSVDAIDEKNGFRSHHFGDDLATFPGLIPIVSYGSTDIKQYRTPKENLQVGDAKLSTITYSFYKDRFYSVLVHANKRDNAAFDKLTAAATSLYGKGKEFSSGNGTGWYGEKVNGSVSIEDSSGYKVPQLHLTSKVIEKQIEADKLSVGKKASSDL
jgi:hypothetical protein